MTILKDDAETVHLNSVQVSESVHDGHRCSLADPQPCTLCEAAQGTHCHRRERDVPHALHQGGARVRNLRRKSFKPHVHTHIEMTPDRGLHPDEGEARNIARANRTARV